MSKRKYVIAGYTPEIIMQDKRLPNITRDVLNQVSKNKPLMQSSVKTIEDQELLKKMQDIVRRNIRPIFNW